jgi:hypothetical protein
VTVTAYPLHWPQGFPRAKVRERGSFKTTLAGALDNVQGSLRRFASDSGRKLETVVMSSNVTLGASRPADPGVAVWFTWDGLGVCIAVDRYQTVEANLQAIHHIIEARRTELRHGTLALVRASFAGFLALPAPTGQNWWQVLGVQQGATAEAIKAAYRKLAAEHHPDRGGDSARMAAINMAYQQSGAT